MSDDLERTLTEALDRHARRLGPRPDGHLDDVWSHLDRRRNRRRGVAAVGSVVAVGAGVAGLALIGPGEPTAPSAGDGAPVTTLTGVAWRCAGLFGDDGVYRYYYECTPVAELPPLTTGWSPFTAPPTVPPSTTALPFDSAATTAPVVAPPMNTAVDVVRYEIAPGDSLFSIATAFGIDPIDIASANGWDDGLDHLLFPGDVIDIAYVPAVTAPPTVPTSSYVPAPTAPVCEDTSEGVTVSVPCEFVPTTTIVFPAVSVGSTTPPAPPPASTTYRCTGVLGTEGGFEYLAACGTIAPDGAVQPGPIAAAPTAPPTAMPATFPPPSTVVPVPTTVTFDASGQIVHVIQPGENPSTVAALYGITVDELSAANPDVIRTFIVDAVLVIPSVGAEAAPPTTPPSVLMPPLIGLTEGRAVDLLAESGFSMALEYQSIPEGDPRDGTVLEQSLVAGSAVRSDVVVVIRIGEAQPSE